MKNLQRNPRLTSGNIIEEIKNKDGSMKTKTVSGKLILNLVNKSKRTNSAVQIKGTFMFLKFTQEDDIKKRFVVYDRNPSLCPKHHSIRLSVSKTVVGEIDGLKRFQKLAESCGVTLHYKEEIKLSWWDRVIRIYNNYLFPERNIILGDSHKIA